jgi:hypothetical protein
LSLASRKAIEDLDTRIGKLPKSGPDEEKRTFDLVKARMAGLKTRLFGGWSDVYLPSTYVINQTVTIASPASPPRIPIGSPSQVVFTGQGLDGIDVALGASVVSGDVDPGVLAGSLQFNNGVLTVDLKPNTAHAPILLKFHTKLGEIVYSPEVYVDPGIPQIISMAPTNVALDPDTSSASAPPKPASVAAVIAGNNLRGHVDVNGTVQVFPAGSATVTGLNFVPAGGEALELDFTVTKADSPIYFKLPTINSSQLLITPPIAVKVNPPPANTAPVPNINQANPVRIDPKTVQVDILGTNLDQIDVESFSKFTVTPASATINITDKKPVFVGGAIVVTVGITDPTIPLVITMPVKGTSSKPVSTKSISLQ